MAEFGTEDTAAIHRWTGGRVDAEIFARVRAVDRHVPDQRAWTADDREAVFTMLARFAQDQNAPLELRRLAARQAAAHSPYALADELLCERILTGEFKLPSAPPEDPRD